jgi:ubiquinone/menaquinone biosynthesis C-methylase UbiE
MQKPWDIFFEEKMKRIFTENATVIDIGGGLRIAKEKNNRFDQKRAWLIPLAEMVNYQVMDPVPDFHPDIVGDIHAMPFKDNSVDAIICITVLEHVEDPIKAFKELYRVLKPGGQCFIYVPFLYYYHAERGYYKDYWRFTKDILDHLATPFKTKERQAVRGALEAWIRISPLGRSALVCDLFYLLDKLFGKLTSNQVGGYHMFLIK